MLLNLCFSDLINTTSPYTIALNIINTYIYTYMYMRRNAMSSEVHIHICDASGNVCLSLVNPGKW